MMKYTDPGLTTQGEGMLQLKIDVKARKCRKWHWLDTNLVYTVNDEYYDWLNYRSYANALSIPQH